MPATAQTFSLLSPSLPIVIIAVIVTAALYLHQRITRSKQQTPPPSPRPSKTKPEEDEKDYKTPAPTPYPNWSIETTKPIAYRPFRHGPKYNVTMGLRTIAPETWIELDNEYPKYHALKAKRIQERGDKCVATDPIAFDAAIELLEELVEYLPGRYPTLFKRTDRGIENLWSGEKFDIVQRPLAEDPMAICARLIQDDFALMIPSSSIPSTGDEKAGKDGEEGEYRLLAGAILLAGFWRLTDKIGMPLSEIHTSGSVPQYQQKLRTGMTNFFRRLRCATWYARNNYFIQVDEHLDWSTSIGSEDSESPSWNTADKNTVVQHHFFRSERQGLRRLPKSRAVCFTIRTYFVPITEISKEPYVPGRLASAVRSWGDDVAKYKGREKYGDVLLEYLDAEHERQVREGLDLSKEDEVVNFPF